MVRPGNIGLCILIVFTLCINNVSMTYGASGCQKETEVTNINAEDAETAAGPAVTSPSVILMEASTGSVIFEKNPDEVLRPASVTKIMTLILIFDAIESGKIALEDVVTVSANAASMGGSQVFLEEGEKQTVDTLIKCIAVASANDASVAMAEYIWGSEQEFVAHMNERARELGMNNTNFVNCCGLDIDNHMTTARDIAYMSRELITKYPQIHDYSSIWMDTITHTTRRGESEFGLTNTNKLMKQYEWATGLKTGSTSLAKCCLSATANRNGIELIAVVMAAPTSKERFADAIALLNYGYGVCNLYKDETVYEDFEVKVSGGIDDSVNARPESEFTYLFINGENTGNIESEIQICEKAKAPVYKGDILGSITYTYNGEDIGSVNILAQKDVKMAGYWDNIVKIFKLWAGYNY